MKRKLVKRIFRKAAKKVIKEEVKKTRIVKPKLNLKPIEDVARSMGIRVKYLERYGHHKTKISLDILKPLKNKKNGKYIVSLILGTFQHTLEV